MKTGSLQSFPQLCGFISSSAFIYFNGDFCSDRLFHIVRLIDTLE